VQTRNGRLLQRPFSTVAMTLDRPTGGHAACAHARCLAAGKLARNTISGIRSHL